MAKTHPPQKRLVTKIIIFGGLPIIFPLVLLLLLITIAIFQLRQVYRDYDEIVTGLHSNLQTIDTRISRDRSRIHQNQTKITEITKRFGKNLLHQQMAYSAGDLLYRLSKLKSYPHKLHSIELITLYLDQTKSPRELLSNAPVITTPPPSPHSPPGATPTPQKSGTTGEKTSQKTQKNAVSAKNRQKTTKNRGAPPPPTPKVSSTPEASSTLKRKRSYLELLEERFNRFLKTTPSLPEKKLAQTMQALLSRVSLGFKNRTLFLIAHQGPLQHRVVWSTEQYWRDRDLKEINGLTALHEEMTSSRYLEAFLAFQEGTKPVRPLVKTRVPHKKGLYTKSKYAFSMMEYYSLIPLYGTTLSLGLKTPLGAQELIELDGIGRSLGEILGFFDTTANHITKVDEKTKRLHHSFTREIDNFKSIFLIMLGLSLLFLLLVFFVEILLVKRRIVKPITHMTTVAERIQQGEFSTRCDIKTDDELQELGSSINAMLDRIVFLIRSDADRQRMQEDILSLLKTVSQASKGDLTVRGAVTTAELQAVNDAFNHMMTSIGALVIKVRKSGMGLEKNTRGLLLSLQSILEKATTQAADLDITSRKIKALGDRSQEITRMVEQIGNIAMETRTLALNATLEASRAGERDTGISHLAEHVRQLAEGLEKTKQDIESFIGSIQLATNYAVNSVHEVLQLTKNTRLEAEQAHQAAGKTYGEAEELGNSISLFKVKTPKDKEKEVELQGGVANIVAGIRSIRNLVNSMDTKEFDSLNVILDDFEKDIDTFGFHEYTLFPKHTTVPGEEEVPAILPEEEE